MAQTQTLRTPDNVLVFPDPVILAHALADELAHCVRAAVTARGICHLVFPGGRSPRLVLELLRERDLPWPALHLYPSDERCVAAGDPERNDLLVAELLLDTVPTLPVHLYSIPAELGPEEGAAQFSQLLARTPPFDIALLGAGPDGHTASLFSNHPALEDQRPAVPVLRAPKPPSERVTISLGRLLAARQRIVIATGLEKQAMLRRIQRGADFPVARLQPTRWYLDSASAGLLDDNTDIQMLRIKGMLN
jgi:6-phosphogluconolactonase